MNEKQLYDEYLANFDSNYGEPVCFEEWRENDLPDIMRAKTLEYVKDMISPSYFEDAVSWALDNCDLGDNCEHIPHIFGYDTPLQIAFEDYIKYLLFPIE